MYRFGEVSCLEETKNTPSLDVKCVNHLIVSKCPSFFSGFPKTGFAHKVLSWQAKGENPIDSQENSKEARSKPKSHHWKPQWLKQHPALPWPWPKCNAKNENGDRLKLQAKLHMMPEGREYVQCGAASNPLVSTTEQWQLIMSSNYSFCIIKRLLPSCMLNKMSWPNIQTPPITFSTSSLIDKTVLLPFEVLHPHLISLETAWSSDSGAVAAKNTPVIMTMSSSVIDREFPA